MAIQRRSAAYLAASLVLPVAAIALGLSAYTGRERGAQPPARVDDLAARPELHATRPTVVVLLGDDLTEITDALGPYEMFARASGFQVVTAAPRRQPTLLTGGLAVLPHYALEELDTRLDPAALAVIVVPNIPNIADARNAPIVRWLQRQAKTDAILLSWCKGAMALAEAGLLDDRTATAHWGDIPTLERAYPRVKWQRGVRWVDHGQLVMSAGITSGIDASLRVIQRLRGRATAARVAAELRYRDTHFAAEPRVAAHTLRAADLIVLANASFHWPRARIGLGLYQGIGELDLSTFYDAHGYTMVAALKAFALDRVVTSAHGLTLMPSITLRDGAALQHFDRLVMPGTRARELGATLGAAVARSARAPRLEYPHADQPGRFGLEPAIEDLAQTADAATARFALKRMEYRGSGVNLGAEPPWRVISAGLLLAALGPLTLWLVRNSAHRQRWRGAPRAACCSNPG